MKHILKISRLSGLTDGIFAIAMTILALDLRLPEGTIAATLPNVFFPDIFLKLIIYVGSFIILGTLWIAINYQLGLLKQVNRRYLWANVFYLMMVCVVPFSASLLARFPKSQISISFFAINLIGANAAQWLTFRTAHKYHLNSNLQNDGVNQAILRNIYIAPVFNILALLFSFWSTGAACLMLFIPPIIYILPGKIDNFD